jgi:hypothetical protein
LVGWELHHSLGVEIKELLRCDERQVWAVEPNGKEERSAARSDATRCDEMIYRERELQREKERKR